MIYLFILLSLSFLVLHLKSSQNRQLSYAISLAMFFCFLAIFYHLLTRGGLIRSVAFIDLIGVGLGLSLLGSPLFVYLTKDSTNSNLTFERNLMWRCYFGWLCVGLWKGIEFVWLLKTFESGHDFFSIHPSYSSALVAFLSVIFGLPRLPVSNARP